MKGIFITFLSIFYILCSILGINKTSYTNSEETVMPTGYPDGELQKQYIFWGGNLYTSDVFFAKDLPEDAYKIGEITKENSINYPNENLEASHINIGVEVYAEESKRYLYVKTSSDGYNRFSITKDAAAGYPDGELQKQYVFWNGNLYTYDVSCGKDLPEDAYKIGEITKEDSINYPDENLEASHINIGVEVYAEKSSQYLYVKTSSDGYERFSITNDAASSEETVMPTKE